VSGLRSECRTLVAVCNGSGFEEAVCGTKYYSRLLRALVSLNDLHYIWPAGFGRFVIEALNPGVRDLQPAEDDQLRQTLGCDLRKIWVHL